jgi:hypothetical protein
MCIGLTTNEFMEVWAIKVLWNLGNHSSENLSQKVLPIQSINSFYVLSFYENLQLAIWTTGSYNWCNKVEDTMSRGTAIYSDKGQNG